MSVLATGFVPRAEIAALPGYVPGARALDPTVAACASNESHLPPLPPVQEVVAAGAAHLNRYPDPACTQLRGRLADDLGVTVDEVVVGPGSVGVLQQLLTAAAGPGDEVVHAWRSFEAYPILTALTGATPVRVPLRPDEHHDLDAMLAAITDRTRVVLVCTPNNPTGVAVDPAALERFLAAVPPRVLVVLDEAYLEFVDPDRAVDGPALYRAHPHVCLLRTFSKAHGLAGLRVGYALARPTVAEAARRAGLPFAVSALAQTAALASLDAVAAMADRVADVRAERSRMQALLRRSGWRLSDSQGNFVWLRLSEPRRPEVMTALAAAGVLARSYPGDGVRITVADRATGERVLTALAGLPMP